MNKLDTEILAMCDESNCCFNELVVLPLNGEVGFEEYYAHKSKLIRKVKKIFTPEEQSKLMLAYPDEGTNNLEVFDLFFESPSVVAKGCEFEGCFAIDITNYIGKEKHEYFNRLVSYIKSNDKAVYVLFIYSNNVNEIQSMYKNLSNYLHLRKVEIPLPTPKQLTEYTTLALRSFCLHIKKQVSDYILKYYESEQFGYDAADYLITKLKYSGYKGDNDFKLLKEIFEEYKNSNGNRASNLGYGY